MKIVPGTVVDRYRVEEEIGRGGMARVYRVRHTTLETLHALKVLTLSGEELRERLVREGKVQARLDHPNVVPVRDILDLEDGPGLLMDFIDGPSLDAWLEEHAPDEDQREHIFTAIAAGVGFAHDQGVVHRDLKPGNVMMQLRHGNWVPRVADFGLAKLVSPEEGEGMLQSRTGRPMGTPAYMAPEQVRSAKHVDARADIFALGCILYELYCGQRAFVGSDSLEVFNRITQGSYLPPRQAASNLEPRVEQAIFGALAVHADDRIPDCPTLLAVLRGDQAWELPTSSTETFFGDFGGDVHTAMPAGNGAVAANVSERDSAPPLPALDSTLVPSPMDGSLVPDPSPPVPNRTGTPPVWALAVGGLAALVVVALLGLRDVPDPPVPSDAPAAPAPVPVAPEPPAPPSAEVAPAEVAPPPVAAPPPPSAVPEPPPLPKPAPVALPTHSARVEVTGDARTVRFRGASGQVADPGVLQPGSYIIEAAFDAGPAMHAGNLDVRAGQTVRLRCSSDTLMCTP